MSNTFVPTVGVAGVSPRKGIKTLCERDAPDTRSPVVRVTPGLAPALGILGKNASN